MIQYKKSMVTAVWCERSHETQRLDEPYPWNSPRLGSLPQPIIPVVQRAPGTSQPGPRSSDVE
ncbi:unnamed protein product [Tuber melanosporum]|uniref:(Perigord truffle) hypothetical protein n=1 Tax=Tuber melanosporum (strain Mel28) TaxID=656061 RepID=D5G5N1_TUBMM|nr:uncharacterized protein GSTUM_00001496001 [Tuber melanosporum]CAZ79824.1 unnamed protein product [Tuber melanosporum]